jgi:two-component system sensor histidine kinase QseC
MIHSIRRFLFISLIFAITLASSITAIGNYLLDEQVIKPYLTGQPYDSTKLTDLIARNNTYIVLITYPIFALLIWLIIEIALRSMTRLSQQIAHRESTNLDPVKAENIPIEIKPLVEELNQLLARLKLAFERNKRFAADTAHELRTPLAALKTQAQVALKTDNETAHQDALFKVVQSVDRCSHIVTQLLTLSSLNQEEALNDIHPVDLHKLTAEILSFLVPLALEKQIDIELAPSPLDTHIMGNEVTLGILIRNVVDNAIRYTPIQGSIKVAIMNANRSIILRVSDTGPGIPIELHERVFDRFYRILGTKQTGSGLGLAIVHQITELHHAEITLGVPANGIGLQFDIQFPAIPKKRS